jgi:hypothetical protein
VKAERSERIAHSLEAVAYARRGLQGGCCGEAAPEILARFAQRLFSRAGGQLPDEEADQLGEPPVGELDALELGRDAVHLRRASGTGAAPAAWALERDGEESRFREPVETAPGDVAVNAECHCDVVRGQRLAPTARVEENPAKLGIAGRCEAVERHRAETLPARASCDDAGRRRGMRLVSDAARRPRKGPLEGER